MEHAFGIHHDHGVRKATFSHIVPSGTFVLVGKTKSKITANLTTDAPPYNDENRAAKKKYFVNHKDEAFLRDPW